MITVTETALSELSRLSDASGADASGAGKVVRLGVKEGGCSGLSYVLEFGAARADGDESFAHGPVTIVVDAESFAVLRGLEVDFVDSLVGGGFRFNNPNAAGSCGCGSSFRVAQQLESADPNPKS